MNEKMINLAWLLLCHVGNYADLSLTLYAISRGVEEANPLMAWLINISPFLFGVVKLTMFSLAIDYVARKIPAALKWISLLYMIVLSWHLSFVFSL